MAYESPINMIMGEYRCHIEENIFKAVQNVGVDVNKEELIKALAYDRKQYEKGYQEGYQKGYTQALTYVLDQITPFIKDKKEEN